MTSRSFRDLTREHMRLAILRLLQGQAGYALNDSVIHGALPQLGFKFSRDEVRVEIAWLADHGLVTTEDMGGLTVASLTQAGLDVADGARRVPGIQKPAPSR